MVTVVLWGQSLALSSIGASLKTQKWLRLVPLDAEAFDIARLLAAAEADVVIFDLAAARPDAFALWKMCPSLLLIGVDVASDSAVLLSRTSTRVATTNDLLELIRGEVPVESGS